MAGQDNEKVVHSEQIETGGANYDTHGQGELGEKALKEEALLGQQNEHNLSLWQALKTYKRAALWSIREYSLTAVERPCHIIGLTCMLRQ